MLMAEKKICAKQAPGHEIINLTARAGSLRGLTKQQGEPLFLPCWTCSGCESLQHKEHLVKKVRVDKTTANSSVC